MPGESMHQDIQVPRNCSRGTEYWEYQELRQCHTGHNTRYTKNTTGHLRIRPSEQLLLYEDLYFSAYFSINTSATYYFFNRA